MCKFEDVTFEVELTTSVSVDANGRPDEEAVICQLMDDVKEWQPSRDPYFCYGCDRSFRRWESAKSHFVEVAA